MSLNIALNVLSAQAGGGVSSFVNLLPMLENIDKKNQYIIFFSNKQKEITEIIPKSFKKVSIDYLPNPYIRVIWEQLLFPLYLLVYKIDILYSVGNITSLLAPCRIVLLLENSNPYSNLRIEWSKKELIRNKLLMYLGRFSAKRADKIRFVSDNSKNLLAKKLNLALEQCVTIYHGINSHSHVKRNNKPDIVELKDNYILAVVVVAPHKNLDRLIKAFKILVGKYNYNGNLIIVGNLCYKDYVEKLYSLIAKMSLSKRIIFTGKVAHKNIKHYYAQADVFVFPSIGETFGIPVIEAMNYGVPIAVSDGNIPSLKDCFIPFREICNDAAHYFDPFDPEDMAKGINSIISNRDYSERLILAGKDKVSQYNLKITVQSLIKLFEEVGSK
jgi:glycosyltransferase involved in cell wall biosynthesis